MGRPSVLMMDPLPVPTQSAADDDRESIASPAGSDMDPAMRALAPLGANRGPATPPLPWVTYTTESGVPYYYNANSGQSVWSLDDTRTVS